MKEPHVRKEAVHAETELLTAEEVGDLLKCSTKQVRLLASAGKIPKPFRIQGLRRWSRSELVAWAESGCKPINKEGGTI